MADRIADRRYPPPLEGADWDCGAVDVVAVALSMALFHHVPGWPGATDEQLTEVAKVVIEALDRPTTEPKRRLTRESMVIDDKED